MSGIAANLQNLVSALGGRDPSEPGNPYVLGDDGLGCLRDIKRWLQHYDEKRDVWEVKTALASMNLVAGDLCPILASWTISDADNEHKRRICLACVEILVPLTWPMELGTDSDELKFKQFPHLRLAQTTYKRSILFDPEHDILASVMRVAYPSLAVPRRERTERDSGIIRLVVYLLRNLAAIDESSNRSDTILAFAKANALEFLCVLASGMGEDFTSEDVIVLDIIYFLLRGVTVKSLFDLSGSGSDTLKNDLTDLLRREKDMRTNNKKQAHTRHNRFGTMVSVVQNSKRFTVASQTAILRSASGTNFAGIEASKKWNKPQKQLKTQDDVEQKVSLNAEARLSVARFVTTFLEAGFNPLFLSLLKALENDDARVSSMNRLEFLYLQGWSFRALREKGYAACRSEKKGSDFADDADYQLVASMMENRATIMLRKMLRESLESKLWKETHAAMNCLKELLLTINSMSLSSDVEYQEIAENLQSNLYYEESNLDLVAMCVRTYTNQSLGYLDACTDLATVLLKMLEKYSSTKTHMFVRARRQRQQKTKQAINEGQAEIVNNSDDEDAEANVRDTVRERAFSFARFESKFVNDHTLDTFVALLEFYADLSSEQIKRVITFFHRVFVKLKIEILLYRMELFELLHRMINDKVGLSLSNPARIEVENFTIYLFKRFTKTIQDCPALAWEILFEKLSNDPYYLTHDENKAPVKRKAPRPPAEFEVRPGLSHEDQIRVAVGVLLDENKSDILDWLTSTLSLIVVRKHSWETEQRARAADAATDDPVDSWVRPSAEVLSPESDSIKLSLFKDGKVRLLLKLISLERTGDRFDVDATWIVPAYLEADVLDTDLRLIRKFIHDPPHFEDGKTPLDLIRRQVSKRHSYTTDSDSDTSSEDEDFSQVNRTKKPTSRRARVNRKLTEVDEEELEARRRKREEMEAQRRGQVKSAKYVHDSDDEDDEAANAIFFAAEAALRERQKTKAATQQEQRSIVPKKPLKSWESIKKKKKNKAQQQQQPSSIVSPITQSSDKENDVHERFSLNTSDVSDTDGILEPAVSRVAISGSRKRVTSGHLKHGNALFVQDDDDDDSDDIGEGGSESQMDTGAKRSKLIGNRKALMQRHIVDSDDE